MLRGPRQPAYLDGTSAQRSWDDFVKDLEEAEAYYAKAKIAGGASGLARQPQTSTVVGIVV
jgi:hypothetical protein